MGKPGEKVLVFPTALLRDLCGGELFQGVRTAPESDRLLDDLLKPDNLQYMDREEAEQNPEFKQLIPYCVIQSDRLFFRYRRTKKGGESRLHEKWSVGIGGHINPSDADPTGMYTDYENGFFREVAEETGLLFKDSRTARESIAGLINDDSDPVGQVHFGVVHLLRVPPGTYIASTDPAINLGIFSSASSLLRDENVFENWSKLVIREVLTQAP